MGADSLVHRTPQASCRSLDRQSRVVPDARLILSMKVRTMSSLVAACHSASCRPPTSGGTGGSSDGSDGVAPRPSSMSARAFGSQLKKAGVDVASVTKATSRSWKVKLSDGTVHTVSGGSSLDKLTKRSSSVKPQSAPAAKPAPKAKSDPDRTDSGHDVQISGNKVMIDGKPLTAWKVKDGVVHFNNKPLTGEVMKGSGKFRKDGSEIKVLDREATLSLGMQATHKMLKMHDDAKTLERTNSVKATESFYSHPGADYYTQRKIYDPVAGWRKFGKDDKPDIVSDDSLDRMMKEGGVELFRGFANIGGKADDFAHEFRTSTEPQVSMGLSGRGYYTTPNKFVANQYTTVAGNLGEPVYGEGKGNIVRMVIKPGAKVMRMADAKKHVGDSTAADYAKRSGADILIDRNTVTGEPYYVIVNRGALAMSETNYA